MAPTYSNGQEMVSIYLIKIKITTKFFKFGQIPSYSVRVQGPSKRPSSGHLYPVSSVKERNRKGGKCKISWVLQSPVPSTQVSPKVEASHRAGSTLFYT